MGSCAAVHAKAQRCEGTPQSGVETGPESQKGTEDQSLEKPSGVVDQGAGDESPEKPTEVVDQGTEDPTLEKHSDGVDQGTGAQAPQKPTEAADQGAEDQPPGEPGDAIDQGAGDRSHEKPIDAADQGAKDEPLEKATDVADQVAQDAPQCTPTANTDKPNFITITVLGAVSAETLWGPVSLGAQSQVSELYKAVAGVLGRETKELKLVNGDSVLEPEGCLEDAGLGCSSELRLIIEDNLEPAEKRARMVREGKVAAAVEHLVKEMKEHARGRGRMRCTDNCEFYQGRLQVVTREQPRCTSPDDNPRGPCSACRSPPRVSTRATRCPEGGMLNKELAELQNLQKKSR